MGELPQMARSTQLTSPVKPSRDYENTLVNMFENLLPPDFWECLAESTTRNMRSKIGVNVDSISADEIKM